MRWSGAALCLAFCACQKDPPPAPIVLAAAAPVSVVLPTIGSNKALALQRFTEFAQTYKTAPSKFPGAAPVCSTVGPAAGTCRDFYHFPDHDEISVEVYFDKSHPSSVRFTTHVAESVSCSDIGAEAHVSWSESDGPAGASGSTCAYRSGPLSGWRALIENNREPGGAFSAGVHVFNSAYVAFDKSLARSISEDESRVR